MFSFEYGVNRLNIYNFSLVIVVVMMMTMMLIMIVSSVLSCRVSC